MDSQLPQSSGRPKGSKLKSSTVASESIAKTVASESTALRCSRIEKSLKCAKADGPDGCRDRPWRLRLDRGAEEPEPRYRLIQRHIVPCHTHSARPATKLSEQRASTYFGRSPGDLTHAAGKETAN